MSQSVPHVYTTWALSWVQILRSTDPEFETASGLTMTLTSLVMRSNDIIFDSPDL